MQFAMLQVDRAQHLRGHDGIRSGALPDIADGKNPVGLDLVVGRRQLLAQTGKKFNLDIDLTLDLNIEGGLKNLLKLQKKYF